MNRLPNAPAVRWLTALGSVVVLAVLLTSALRGEALTTARNLTESQLIAQQVSRPPIVDGEMDPIWNSAPLARIPLTRRESSRSASLEVELRSLYAGGTVYFLAAWEEVYPSFGDGSSIRNRFVLHFDQDEPWPGAREVTCLVACHTAFSDASGEVAHVIAETIPQGASNPLPAAGGWSGGEWHLEWSRPLVNDNLFDVQFQDLDASYPFFVKVFEWMEGQADPVSGDYVLVFRRQ